MFVCPRCKNKVEVVGEYATDIGIKRRLKCMTCGHECKTLEKRLLAPHEARERYVALERCLHLYFGICRAFSKNSANEFAVEGKEAEYMRADKEIEVIKEMMRDVRYHDVDGRME